MRPYHDEDRAALEQFLRRHVATSMFPLGNLIGDGLATEAWIVEGPQGLSGYLGRAANGNLLPQWPRGDWSQARAMLAGKMVAGLVGPPDQVHDLLSALGLAGVVAVKSEIQPGFSLTLNDLRLPDCAGLVLRPVLPVDSELLTDWRTGYNLELSVVDAAKARDVSADEVARMIRTASHWLLLRGNQPVAMAGINASVPGVVQVGGVFTPPAQRGLGFARKAVALMLAQLRAQGAQLALLFAASDNAAQAYRAIGFQPSHSFAIHLFSEPKVVPCP